MKKAAVFLWALALWLGVAAQALAANAFNVDAAGNISATSLATLSVSVTGNISATTINGSVPVFGGAPAWNTITGVPTVLQNISNSTGSVTVTSINAAAATLTSISAGSLTASGIVSANTLDAFFISGTQVSGVTGLFPGGLTVGNVTSNVTIAGGTLTATSLVSAVTTSGTYGYFTNISATSVVATGTTGTVTATNVYGLSVSGTTGTFGSIGTGAIAMTGALTGSTSISTSSGGTVSGTNLYGLNISGSSIFGTTVSGTLLYGNNASLTTVLAGTVSTTGTVSNSNTYSNYMREGILAITASTPTTAVPLNVATGISLTLTSNTTISFTNPNNAQANVAVLKIEEDSTGGRTLTWPANARYNGNVTPTLTTTALTFSQCTAAPIPGSTNILIGCPATGVSN